MRVADVDRQTGERAPTHHGGTGAELIGLAHLDTDVGERGADGMEFDRPGPGQGADHELAAALQPGRPQVVGEDPHPVAAHLRRRPVGVAVVHEPVICGDTVGQALEHTGRQQRTGRGDAKHAVGAQPPPAIAQGGHR